MLSKLEIAPLYASKQERKQAAQPLMFTRKNGEQAEWRASTADTRSFDSKQGTVARSRKGVSRIKPNGYARYYPTWEEEQVIAYKAPAVVT